MNVHGQEATYCPKCSHPQGVWATYVPTDEWPEHQAFHAAEEAQESR